MPEPTYLRVQRQSGAVAELRPPVEHIKALLARAILSAMSEDCLTASEVERLTGFDASDLSRIRNGSLARFSADRLLNILLCLGRTVEVMVGRPGTGSHPPMQPEGASELAPTRQLHAGQ